MICYIRMLQRHLPTDHVKTISLHVSAAALADTYGFTRRRKWSHTPILSFEGVNSLSNRTALSFMKDLMRSLIAEALAGSMIQYFHGGCKLSPG